MLLSIILLVFALVLFVVAGIINPPEPNPGRVRLVCYGLACLAAAELFAKAGPLFVNR